MQDIITDIVRWRKENQKIALASVVETWGSSPRPIGAKMAVNMHSGISGSVSAGCVEGAVVEESLQSLQTGRAKLLQYGVSDDAAFEVGLMCGGKIEIFVRPLSDTIFEVLHHAILKEVPAALVSVIEGDSNLSGREILFVEGQEPVGTINPDLDDSIQTIALQAMAKGKCQRVTLETPTPVSLFIDAITPPPTLVMIGGVHISIALAQVAKNVGYRTIVVDPRKAFSSRERFPLVDKIFQSFPEEAFQQAPLKSTSAVAVLSHDPKIDDPALIAAFNSPAFYIGALGSRRTQALRYQRMLDAGITQTQLERLHAPIGLNIGARTPEEIALAILAEIVQVRHQ